MDMTDKIDKIRSRVSGDLLPGEVLEAAVKVTPRGNIESTTLGMAGGMAAGVVGLMAGEKLGESARESGAEERSAAGIDLGGEAQVLAGVTDQRLLMWKLSALGGKPKELLASMPLTEIASMELGEGKLMGQKMPEIICETTSGAVFGLRVAKVHKKDAETLIAASGK